MQAKPEYRDRPDAQVAVLDALAERGEEGMTVFEIRSRVAVDIDRLETALAALKADDLIEAMEDGDRTVIVPDASVIGPEPPEQPDSILETLREKFR